MRRLIVPILLSSLALVGCDKIKAVFQKDGSTGSPNVTLTTDVERGSYAIGSQIGRSIKGQNMDVSIPQLMAGISDSMAAAQLKLTQDEMRAAITKMQDMAQQQMTKLAESNLKEGEEFLVKNKAKPNIKTTASGLQYEVVQEGTGATPADTDRVKVHYTGTLLNGTKFDSSVDRGQPAEFPVGGVIPGWTEALKLMKVGAKYKLAIPATLAYGSQPRPSIPPNSALLFDVELIAILPPEAAGAPPPAPAGAPGGNPHGG